MNHIICIRIVYTHPIPSHIAFKNLIRFIFGKVAFRNFNAQSK